MRFLGVDYGSKRWGLSYGDELGLAVPLAAATDSSAEERFARLAREIATRRVTELVVGYPYNMDGTAGFKAREVDTFIVQLERRFKLPVHRTDERLTSQQAEAQARAASPKRARAKTRSTAARQASRATGEIDSRAAALILQDFLDTRFGPPLLPSDENQDD
jgi:putative holliday junction resolvase